ncbi:MAG: 2-iminobutanoate/2-iminopropanoate deaminase [Solirubrobacteraceae bacterium]|jgi:2-iminobutanoate/2-iminopropanoate deaminase|nr:2-iminobutanoate/2-iminopropanoate deaminase [Solirubrobacteraceae bacterium]
MREQVTGTQPAGAYSPGIVAEGRFLYVSGQGPIRDGETVNSTIEEETRITLTNLGKVLAEAGAGYDDVVRCGVFITRPEDFGAMNDVYREFFSDPLPARTTVVAGLVGGIKVEIDCVAVLE